MKVVPLKSRSPEPAAVRRPAADGSAGDDLAAFLARRHAAERRLADIERLLDEHYPVAFIDRLGTILDVNSAFCRISQYDRSELIGRSHHLLASHVHPQAFWSDLWTVIAGGHTWRGEICNRAKDGSLYWVNATIVPRQEVSGRVAGYAVLSIEITPP